MSRRARRTRFHRWDAARRAERALRALFDPVAARRADEESARGPEALAMGEVAHLLNRLVGDGAPLRDRPGIYEREGVALFHDGAGFVLAVRPAAVVAAVHAELARRGVSPVAAPTAVEFADRLASHPWFLGVFDPPGATTQGWIGVRLTRDAAGGLDA